MAKLKPSDVAVAAVRTALSTLPPMRGAGARAAKMIARELAAHPRRHGGLEGDVIAWGVARTRREVESDHGLDLGLRRDEVAAGLRLLAEAAPWLLRRTGRSTWACRLTHILEIADATAFEVLSAEDLRRLAETPRPSVLAPGTHPSLGPLGAHGLARRARDPRPSTLSQVRALSRAGVAAPLLACRSDATALLVAHRRRRRVPPREARWCGASPYAIAAGARVTRVGGWLLVEPPRIRAA